MDHPIYQQLVRKRQPVVVQSTDGEPLTLVPHPTGTPDLVTFSVHRADGSEVAPATRMGRWDFEQLAQRLIPAPATAPRYTPPKPKPLSSLERARFARSWTRAQAQVVADYVKTAMPYLGPAHIEQGPHRGRRTSPAGNARYHVLIFQDREKGVTLRASAWRDLAEYHELRGLMPNGIGGQPATAQREPQPGTAHQPHRPHLQRLVPRPGAPAAVRRERGHRAG